MSQPELLIRVIQALNAAEIEYMLTGSFASSLQGEPRSTHDIDLVIALSPECSSRLVEQFQPPDFYLDEYAVRDAISHKSMFNLLDVCQGDKVDFWMLTGEPYDVARFARRQSVSVLGVEVSVSAPEDTILAKLRWARLSGGSEKQFTDALRVFEVQRDGLDMTYMQGWADKLGVQDLLAKMIEESELVD